MVKLSYQLAKVSCELLPLIPYLLGISSEPGVLRVIADALIGLQSGRL